MKTSKNPPDSKEFIDKIELEIKRISEAYINEINADNLLTFIKKLKKVLKISN